MSRRVQGKTSFRQSPAEANGYGCWLGVLCGQTLRCLTMLPPLWDPPVTRTGLGTQEAPKKAFSGRTAPASSPLLWAKPFRSTA